MSNINDQLNLRLRHPDYQKYLDVNEKQSERIRQSLSGHLDQKYGRNELQSIDIFPSRIANSPILIFIHGGYWRGLDKRSYSFVAEPYVKNDITVCVLNYRLLPHVNMQTILEDIKVATNWIIRKAQRFNGDSNNVILSGHSAGGHLSVFCYLLNDCLRKHVRAICSLSGIFELAPIKSSYLNQDLKLDEADVKKFSVSEWDNPSFDCPVFLGVGSAESDFFVSQSKMLNRRLMPNTSAVYNELNGLNHYEVAHQLGSYDSEIFRFILDNSNS